VIDLIAADDARGFGVATALDLEGICYRRIAPGSRTEGRCVVIARDEPGAIGAALARQRPTVVVGAVPGPVRVIESAVTIPLDAPVWPPAVRTVAARFGIDALRLPPVPVIVPQAALVGKVLATARRADGEVQPAILQDGSRVWTLVDLGTALTNLLEDTYRPVRRADVARRLPRAALALYYRAPERVRAVVQRRAYARLERELDRQGDVASAYPVDPSGWLLLELVKHLVRCAAGPIVRLARWPLPYTAAAALTHDIEPTRYAYREGLELLLDRARDDDAPTSFALVAANAARCLGSGQIARLRDHEVLCHGLEHLGETLEGSRDEITAGLIEARNRLECALGRPVAGFRSPRLDRSPDLLHALDRSGFSYDSSYPDVDRENSARFGGGVCMNLPFRPPLRGTDGRVRASACLELPISAPDCIQPLFAGRSVAHLRETVAAKLTFVQATAGLYVGIVHAGVFGPNDAARRLEHLTYVRRQLRQPTLWVARIGAIADWWRVREGLRVTTSDGWIDVVNEGDTTARGAALVVEAGDCDVTHRLPDLASGEAVRVPARASATRPATSAGSRA